MNVGGNMSEEEYISWARKLKYVTKVFGRYFWTEPQELCFDLRATKRLKKAKGLVKLGKVTFSKETLWGSEDVFISGKEVLELAKEHGFVDANAYTVKLGKLPFDLYLTPPAKREVEIELFAAEMPDEIAAQDVIFYGKAYPAKEEAKQPDVAEELMVEPNGETVRRQNGQNSGYRSTGARSDNWEDYGFGEDRFPESGELPDSGLWK